MGNILNFFQLQLIFIPLNHPKAITKMDPQFIIDFVFE